MSLLNLIRREATKVVERRVWARLGVVSAVDPETYTARVVLRPGGHETGWLPIGTVAVGAGWGFAALPDGGDHVLVVFRDGSLNSGVITARFFNAKKAPITGVELKEFALRHESGSKLHFKANGDVLLVTKKLDIEATGAVTIDATGVVGITGSAVTISGDLDVTGNIEATGTVHGTNI